MTKEQRANFDRALRELDECEECRSDRSARAGYVADALRILNARLDEIEAMATRALLHKGHLVGRENSCLRSNQT